MRNEALTQGTCLAKGIYRQVQPAELDRNLLTLSSCPSPASGFRTTLPRLPCIFQPTMYPFIKRHHTCCKLKLIRVRGCWFEVAIAGFDVAVARQIGKSKFFPFFFLE